MFLYALSRLYHGEWDLWGDFKIYKLVYVTSFDDIDEAITHEKKLKKWKRPWKDALIEETNPGWHDISGEFWSEN